MYWDTTLLILLPAVLLGAAARMWMDAVYRRYTAASVRSNVTAAEAARGILDRRGAGGVVLEVRGERALTDYYDPRGKRLVLSEPIYHGYSIAALGVAAHEAGHAIQDAEGYPPLRLRAAMAPAAAFGSNASMPLVLLGILLAWVPVVWAGIALYALAVVFHLITLPVELDASRRALEALETGGYLTRDEVPGARAVLSAAAMTYAAAALSSLLSLLRLVLLASDGRRRR